MHLACKKVHIGGPILILSNSRNFSLLKISKVLLIIYFRKHYNCIIFNIEFLRVVDIPCKLRDLITICFGCIVAEFCRNFVQYLFCGKIFRHFENWCIDLAVNQQQAQVTRHDAYVAHIQLRCLSDRFHCHTWWNLCVIYYMFNSHLQNLFYFSLVIVKFKAGDTHWVQNCSIFCW